MSMAMRNAKCPYFREGLHIIAELGEETYICIGWGSLFFDCTSIGFQEWRRNSISWSLKTIYLGPHYHDTSQPTYKVQCQIISIQYTGRSESQDPRTMPFVEGFLT